MCGEGRLKWKLSNGEILEVATFEYFYTDNDEHMVEVAIQYKNKTETIDVLETHYLNNDVETDLCLKMFGNGELLK